MIEALVLGGALVVLGAVALVVAHVIAVLHAKAEDAARKKRAGSSTPVV